MTTLEQIIIHSQKLPETLQNEVLDFITFLEAKYLSQSTQMDTDTPIEQLVAEHGEQTKQQASTQTLTANHSVWPSAIRDLAGAWTDFPTAEEIRKSLSEDLPREPF
jgi:hypothetical protein